MPNKKRFPSPADTASSVSYFPSVRGKECTLVLTLAVWLRGTPSNHNRKGYGNMVVEIDTEQQNNERERENS